MKLKLSALVLTLIFTQPAMAISTAKPKNCPSISSIANIGVNNVVKNRNYWIGKRDRSKFDTMEEWSFTAITDVSDSIDKAGAIREYNQKLSMLSYVEGPIPSEDGSWLCYYQSQGNAYNHIAVYAYNPPFIWN